MATATYEQVLQAVAAEETIESSLIALVQALAAAAPSPSTLAALVAQINSDATAMAAAVLANTPEGPASPAPASP